MRVPPRAAGPFLLLLLLSHAAGAVTAGDFVGTRTVGMSAARASATANEAIFLNPAGLGLTTRYSLQLDYDHDTSAQSVATSGGDALVVSIADSVSNPRIPTGIAYRYFNLGSGDEEQKGHITDLAVAFPLSGSLLFGMRLSYIAYTSGNTDLMRFTGDIGTLLVLGGFSVGAVGFNLINVDSPDSKRGFAAGVSYGDRMWRLGTDYRLDYESKAFHTFSVGGELLLADAIPLRGGYVWDGLRNTQFWSAGIGLVTQQFGFDFSYRRDTRTTENLLAFSVKLFVH